MPDGLWAVSVAATVLVWLGFVPEFLRLWREKRAGGAGCGLWAIWTGSAALSLVYAAVSEAPILVICNCAVISGLSAVAALWNACLPAQDGDGERSADATPACQA